MPQQMNDEGSILQRDQIKKHNLQRNGNSNLSSPFPFMEFGLNSHSSLTNILNGIPRETELTKRTPTAPDVNPDPYLRPLNFDRLKSNGSSHQTIPSFIRSSSSSLRNNDFSANVFLRLQSARIDSTIKTPKMTPQPPPGGRERLSVQMNGQHRPSTAIIDPPKQQRPLSALFTPVVSTRFYNKSFRTDALIGGPQTLFPPSEIVPIDNPPSKIDNGINDSRGQSLYLQVKGEVARYRQERLALAETVAMAAEAPQNVTMETEAVQEAQEVHEAARTVARARSVTFSDKVETRHIEDDSLSEDSPDDSDDSSSSEDDLHGSVVSTDSESGDEHSIASTCHSPQPQTPLSHSSPNSKEGSPAIDENHTKDSVSSSEEDNDVLLKNGSSTDTDTSSHSIKDTEGTQENLLNGNITSKSSLSSDSSASSISGSIVNQSPFAALSRVASKSSASSASSAISKKTTRKFDSKTRSKSKFSKQDLLDMKVFQETQLNMPLIFSKFPFVPPVINFVGEGEKVEQLPWQLRKLLRWRTSLLTPVIVKQIITRSGFRPSRLTTATDDLENVETNDWILYFGKHMKGPVFSTLKNYQKVNHFPGSFQLGRKDRLWRNIYKMQLEVGKKEFDFIPQTFCLPTDLELFKQCWENGGNKHKWIIKPPASARGIGVKVVYKWNQIPKRRPVVVQRYIANPYLINESKFDLRLYVFLSSIDPLRIYLFDDGLVRFASTKYTNSLKSLHNRFVHLTNYSVNKLNVEYLDNNDNEACKGHKWSLKCLWNYLRKRGVNTDTVWDRIKDLVVKTVISAEEMISASVKAYCTSTYNVKELFGFDVLLDENLKPWILEVNVSPSLHSDTPLDVVVKGSMIKDVLNLSGFMLPEVVDIDPPANSPSKSPAGSDPCPSSDLNIDQRFWIYTRSADEVAKQKHIVTVATNGHPDQRFDLNSTLPYQILDCLTPGDVRCLVDCYDEYERRGHFQRVFPVPSTVLAKKYLSCCEKVRYSNLLLSTFLTKYHHNGQDVRLLEKLCQKKLHILSSENGDKIDSKHVWRKTDFSGDK